MESGGKMKETVIVIDQNELFDRLVVNDTINDTINSLSDNERIVFEEMQIRPKVVANELSEKLDINLRNTKKIIEILKEKRLVKRIGSRKAGHWEVVEKR